MRTAANPRNPSVNPKTGKRSKPKPPPRHGPKNKGPYHDVISRWLPGGRFADDVVAVCFEAKAGKKYRDAVIREAGGLPLKYRIGIADGRYFLVRAAGKKLTGKAWAKSALSSLAGVKGVVRVAPVFSFGCGYAVATDKLIIRTASPIREHSGKFKKAGVRLLRQRQKTGVLRLPTRTDPLELIAAFDKRDWIEDAVPDFAIIRLRPQGYDGKEIEAPKWQDRNASYNYSLHLTGAYDVWKAGYSGKPDIRIAIIDSGVDTDHRDLNIAEQNRYDATDMDYYQEPSFGDDHGTAVAGLAGGMPASDTGVRGIGSGCSLISIKIGSYAPEGIDVSYFTSHILWAIHWAWNEFRSDVICLSFSLPEWYDLAANINNALKLGRGGKGCVVIGATGNYGDPICFPAKIPEVLAVTSTNQYDEFKSWNSRDGESTWASSCGPEADVAAPGVALASTANTNLDFQRTARYGIFSGTSFAAPQVAGLAGLILSINPALTGAEVREIIKKSADKVGDHPYQDGHNNYLGYGRINIANAVKLTPH